MGQQKNVGFTIVETMLFLAISGMLAAGVLVGTGSAISTQRYRDSVASLRSFFQQQYTDTANVSNDGLDACAGADRGQSDCVILGKYVETSDSSTFHVKVVVGTIPGNLTATNDIDAFKQYAIKVLPTDISYQADWGSTVKTTQSGGGGNLKLSVLIMRSPLSGVIRTFISSGQAIEDSKVSDLLTASGLSQSATMCVDPNGFLSGATLGVGIQAGAAGTDGVVKLGDNSGC